MKEAIVKAALGAIVGIVLVVLFGMANAHAAGYSRFVVVQDIVMQDLNGELRFCERKHLRGIICGQELKFLGMGKARFMAQDWWTPETYVEAHTGIPAGAVEVPDIRPTGDGRGLVIYYRERLQGGLQ